MPGNFRPVQCHFVLRSDLSCQLQAVGNFITAQNSMAKNTQAASNTFNGVCLASLGQSHQLQNLTFKVTGNPG